LLPNDLIIVRNHRVDEVDEQNINTVQERQGDAHIKVEIQSNLEFDSLTSSPTQSPRSPCLQINVHDVYEIRFGHSTYAQKEDKITFPMELFPCPTKMRFNHNCQNNFNIKSLSHLGVVHIKTDAHVAYNI
jgi:hypothetical protein